MKMLNENFEDIAPALLFFEQGTDRSKAFSKLLKAHYFPYETIDVRSFASLLNIFTDGMMGYPVHKFLHAISNETKTYYYMFSYIGRYSYFKYPRNLPWGVNHSDDIQYILHTPYIGPAITPSDPEWLMVDRMTRVVENFAHTG